MKCQLLYEIFYCNKQWRLIILPMALEWKWVIYLLPIRPQPLKLLPFWYQKIIINLNVLGSWFYVIHDAQGTITQSHYNDVIMSAMTSQITGVSIVCATVVSGVYQRKHQSSASLAFVRGIHRRPVNSPHKMPVTRKLFPFDDVIMLQCGVQ